MFTILSEQEREMGKFLITPHFRLHEWVAEEKGYFKSEGLDYEFRAAFNRRLAFSSL